MRDEQAPRPDGAGPGPLRSRLIERSPVFYGWVVLAVATLGLIMTTPGQTVGVSVFLDPIIDDLGAERQTVSLLYTIGTLAGATALPFVGRALDRHGPRIVVTLVAAGLALACLFMAVVRDLFMLAIGFVLIRGLGQGSLSLVSLHTINVWFVRRRGLAIGLSGIGMAVAVAFFPLLIEWLVTRAGWRTGYALLGALVALTILPLGALFFRQQPERYGVAPDSRSPQPVTEQRATHEVAIPAAEARRTYAFWFVALSVAVISALGTGLVFHHFDLMLARGLGRLAAAQVFVPLALTSAATNLTAGLVLDRIAPRFVLAAMLAAQSAALVAATAVGPATLPVYGVLIGMSQGMMGAVSGTVYAAFFGRRAIGGIRGTAQTLSVAGAAAGPALLAFGEGAAGSYVPVLLAAATLPAVMAVAALFLRRPQPPHRHEPKTPRAS